MGHQNSFTVFLLIKLCNICHEYHELMYTEACPKFINGLPCLTSQNWVKYLRTLNKSVNMIYLNWAVWNKIDGKIAQFSKTISMVQPCPAWKLDCFPTSHASMCDYIKLMERAPKHIYTLLLNSSQPFVWQQLRWAMHDQGFYVPTTVLTTIWNILENRHSVK